MDYFLYKDPLSKVRVDGHCSELFKVVRQGDTLLPILLALNIEPLAEAICPDHQIQEITDERGSIHKIATNRYKMIQNKAEEMMISGNGLTHINEDVSFHWSRQGVRYLGVILTPHPMQLFDANYNKLFKQRMT